MPGSTRAPLIALTAFAALVAGCGIGPAKEGAAALPKETKLGSLIFNDKGTKDATGKTELDVAVDSFYFEPTFIKGAPGQTLTVKLENRSGAQHTFTTTTAAGTTGAGVDQTLAPKAKGQVQVTFPRSGVLRFYCRFHASQGMNGELLAGNAAPQAVAAGATARAGY